MASLDSWCFNPLNLKNKITKIEHEKIFRGPSKTLKYISWPINTCLKYFKTPIKTLQNPVLHTYAQAFIRTNMECRIRVSRCFPSLYQIFKIILNRFIKNHRTLTKNPSIKIYVNRTENQITFNLNNEYYLQLSTTETMKILGSSEKRISKDKNDE